MDTTTQSNPAKLFVGNLPYSVTTEMLREKFSAYGNVVDAIVMTDKFSGRSKGFGFVTMGNEQEAQDAIAALNEAEMDGRKMLVNVARPKAPRDDRGGFDRNRGGSRGGFGSDRRRNDKPWNN